MIGLRHAAAQQQLYRLQPLRAADDAAAAALADDDDIDWTEDMPAPVKRRVAALREVQGEYDALNREFVKERADLQAKYEQRAAPLGTKRAAIVAGGEAVGEYGVADDGEPDAGIPDFWLTALTNHDMVGEYVTERDAEVLAYLSDVRVRTLTGEDAGSFALDFAFRQNPFFTNEVLTKTFYMEDPDEIVPDRFVGCDIDWAPGKDTTVQQVKKRVGGGKKGGGGGKGVTVTSTKPCDSFFNFFKTPVVPENPDDLSEEELEALQEQMDEDYEIGIALKESVVPRAVEWFTGEAAPPMYDEFDEGEEGGYGDYAEEDDEEEAAPRGGKRR